MVNDGTVGIAAGKVARCGAGLGWAGLGWAGLGWAGLDWAVAFGACDTLGVKVGAGSEPA